MKRVGYARVSKDDQNLERQLDALDEVSCHKVFREKMTGTKASRPELDELLDYVREGDEVYVQSYSRIGRNMLHLLQLIDRFKEMNIAFVTLDFNLRITRESTAIEDLLARLFAALAQFERDQISERTRHGLDAARKRGRIGGRPPGMGKAAKEKSKVAATLWQSNEHTIKEICEILKISKTSLYKYLRHQGIDPQDPSAKLISDAENAE